MQHAPDRLSDMARAPREPWILDPDHAPVGVARLVALAGSIEAAAELAGVSVQTLYRWRSDWKGGGLSGGVPPGRVRLILINADKAGVEITRGDLVED